jgi:pimeloyl-ACP methyl ester carboxylesterase
LNGQGTIPGTSKTRSFAGDASKEAVMRLISKGRNNALLDILLAGIAIPLFMLWPSGAGSAWAQACQQGTYSVSGHDSLYYICVPPKWNGDLVVYAHGYTHPDEPLAIVDNVVDGVPISEIITSLGYAFATTSYRANGLVIPEAVEDVVGLVQQFPTLANASEPNHVYLVGASEGGLVTSLAIEKYPEVFSGGLAACGPCGDFRRQLNYMGDFLVVFNHFFPGLLGASTPESIPQEVMDNWQDISVNVVLPAIQANRHLTRQLLRVTDASIDPGDPESIGETVLGVLEYAVFATNDAVEKLGGHSFDNHSRWYSGSDNDLQLNLKIERYTADKDALESIDKKFQTSGSLQRPLVTVHTTADPIVPYWHEPLYNLKILRAGSSRRHVNIPVIRYGHCTFTQNELLASFAILGVMVALQ